MGNEFNIDDELSQILNKYSGSSTSEPKTEYKSETKLGMKPSEETSRAFDDVTKPTLKVGGSTNKIRVNKTAVRANSLSNSQTGTYKTDSVLKSDNTETKKSEAFSAKKSETISTKKSDKKAEKKLFNKSDKKTENKPEYKPVNKSENKPQYKPVDEDDGFTDVNSPAEEPTRQEPEHVMSRGEIMKHKTTKQDRVKAERARKKYRRVNTILNVLLVLFILIFLGSGGYLIRYYLRVRKAESGFTSLRSELPESEAAIEEIEKEFPPEQITIDEDTGLHYVDINGVQVQTKFVHLYKQNDHFIGWLNVPDTVIDYPVMYTPFDEEYYLHKDFDKEYSASGTLFVGAKNDPLAPSDNVIIYGHNMKAGTMFHGLLDYESEDFYKKHKTFTFDTIEGNYEYEVIAAFRTKISEDDFKYYAYVDFADEAEFNNYVAQAKMQTPYIIEESALYGDKLLTLSTCAYHANEGRFVVVAKRVDKTDAEDTSESEE